MKNTYVFVRDDLDVLYCPTVTNSGRKDFFELIGIDARHQISNV